MYNSAVIDRRLSKIADHQRQTNPRFKFIEVPLDVVDQFVLELSRIYNQETGAITRRLTRDEDAFITHEVLRCKADARYWMTRYAFIRSKSQELIRLNPTAVQDFLLKRIAEEELASVNGETGDGIILMVLKARQLGISSISEALIAHRILFYANTSAMIAADIEERSAHLFDMTERIYDNLPWWMKPNNPERDYWVKDKQRYFSDQDSQILVGWGKNMQAGSQGSLGTGMTFPLVHLSELAIWKTPEQIDDALMPSIPYHPRTFALFESTAKGRGNWWHLKWLAAKKGIGRRKPVFIPWYTDPATYTLPAPADYKPSQLALAHAVRATETSAYWLGYTVKLTKDQLYWWERTRESYIADQELYKFLAEYTADDMEAFQNTTMSVLPSEFVHEARQNLKPQAACIEILPRTELRKGISA
jgi:hypothetical protein